MSIYFKAQARSLRIPFSGSSLRGFSPFVVLTPFAFDFALALSNPRSLSPRVVRNVLGLR